MDKDPDGIEQRHISDGPGTTWMAAEAAKLALKDAGVEPEDIDIIIAATTTADNCFQARPVRFRGFWGQETRWGMM